MIVPDKTETDDPPPIDEDAILQHVLDYNRNSSVYRFEGENRFSGDFF